MQGQEAKLYVILRNGALHHYPSVSVGAEASMPSGGDLSNPGDRELVKDIEDQMIEVFGHAIIEIKSEQAEGGILDLSQRMAQMTIRVLFP